jgi:hypothetical protein
LYFSVSVSKVQRESASAHEVYIKEEPTDDAEASTSGEHLLAIKKHEAIDIKHEPLTTEEANVSLNLVSIHV